MMTMIKNRTIRVSDPKMYRVEEAQIEQTLPQKVLFVEMALLVPRQLLSRLQT